MRLRVMVSVPQKALLRNRTGMRSVSSLYQIRMFDFPVTPTGCTRTATDIPFDQLILRMMRQAGAVR